MSTTITTFTSAYSSSDSSGPTRTAVSRALAWLAGNQQHDGSYGAYSEIQTPAAAYALWLNDSRSGRSLSSFKWLAGELDNSSSGIWGQYAEADIHGEIVYSLSLTNNLGLLHNSSDYRGILSLQQPSGGFKGFFDTNGQQVESSVDTSMALLGLANAKAVGPTSQQAAVNYLVRLSNSDGSFNLTRNTISNQFSALGPEPFSVTALVLLAMRAASYPAGSQPVPRALNYLKGAASGNFSGHVYAATLSSLVFDYYDLANVASRVTAFIISKQNSDGGYADSIRSSAKSNPLDTGWAAIALQLVQTSSMPTGPLLGPLMITEITAIAVVTVVALAGIALYLRRRESGASAPS